jgi:hypothetical protein
MSSGVETSLFVDQKTARDFFRQPPDSEQRIESHQGRKNAFSFAVFGPDRFYIIENPASKHWAIVHA